MKNNGEKREIRGRFNLRPCQTVFSFKQKGSAFHSEVLVGDVAKSLADYAESHDIDLIVMASHGHSGIKRWIMGSVADKLFRSVSLPVFMVRAIGNKSEG